VVCFKFLFSSEPQEHRFNEHSCKSPTGIYIYLLDTGLLQGVVIVLIGGTYVVPKDLTSMRLVHSERFSIWRQSVRAVLTMGHNQITYESRVTMTTFAQFPSITSDVRARLRPGPEGPTA
jgi:hypothetical protein